MPIEGWVWVFQLAGDAEAAAGVGGRGGWIHGGGSICCLAARGDGRVAVGGRAVFRGGSVTFVDRAGESRIDATWNGGHAVCAHRVHAAAVGPEGVVIFLLWGNGGLSWVWQVRIWRGWAGHRRAHGVSLNRALLRGMCRGIRARVHIEVV